MNNLLKFGLYRKKLTVTDYSKGNKMKAKIMIVFILAALILVIGCNGSDSSNKAKSADSSTSQSSENSITSMNAPSESVVIPHDSSSSKGSSSESTVAKNEEKQSNSKILILYFSRVGISESFDKVDAVSSASLPNGNTIVIANYIKEATGGDMFQLITDKVYPANYDATTDLAQKEQRAGERPSLKSQPKNLADYNVIFLGYPNWWGTIPMAYFTFLENNDLSGKTIIPFCTHEGSALGDSQRDITKLCPKSKIVDGLAVRGGSVTGAKNEVDDWIKKIGFHK